jgi:hypothetical protein
VAPSYCAVGGEGHGAPGGRARPPTISGEPSGGPGDGCAACWRGLAEQVSDRRTAGTRLSRVVEFAERERATKRAFAGAKPEHLPTAGKKPAIVTARRPGKRFADVPDMTEDEHRAAGDRADAMMQEFKRQIAEKLRK